MRAVFDKLIPVRQWVKVRRHPGNDAGRIECGHRRLSCSADDWATKRAMGACAALDRVRLGGGFLRRHQGRHQLLLLVQLRRKTSRRLSEFCPNSHSNALQPAPTLAVAGVDFAGSCVAPDGAGRLYACPPKPKVRGSNPLGRTIISSTYRTPRYRRVRNLSTNCPSPELVRPMVHAVRVSGLRRSRKMRGVCLSGVIHPGEGAAIAGAPHTK